MTFTKRRMSAALLAATMVVTFAAAPVFAQATNGPVGGVGSTTAPSNSEGTPAGGSGAISTTRVGPSTQATPTPRPRRHRHRHRHHPAASTTGTQSDSGLNGSATPTR